VHVVWLKFSGLVDEIYYSKLDGAGGILIDQKRITAEDDQEEYWVDIAADSNGYLHLVWRHRNETINNNEIHYAKLDNNGNTVLSRVISSDDHENANYPKIAVDDSDNVHIVYDKDASGYATHEVYYTKLDNAGNTLVSEVELTVPRDDLKSHNADLAPTGDGDIHVAWKDARGSWMVYWSLLDSSGAPVIDDTGLSPTVQGYSGPSLAVGASDNLYGVWVDDRDGPIEVYFNSYDGQWAADVRLTAGPSGLSYDPEIAVDANENLHVTWRDSRDGNEEIYYIRGTLCVTPTAPALSSPAHQTRTPDDTPSFTWDSVDSGATYQLQVADNPGFSAPAIDVDTAETTHTATPMSAGTYYWRVRATTACGASDWSSVWEVTIVGEPAVPILISPPNTDWTCDTTPTFFWNPVDDAISYTLQVDDSSLFDSPEVDASQSGTSYTPGTPLNPDTYYWRANGTNDFFTGSWSDVWTVSILGPPTIPDLLSPYSGSVIDDRTPTLDWSSATGASTYHLQVDDDLGFASPEVDELGILLSSHTVTTPLEHGGYYWRVRALGVCADSDWSQIWSFTVDDLQGPTIGTPDFGSTVGSNEHLSVEAWIEDASTGGNGVGEATLCYGYTAPYAESCLAGTGPGGNGDGLWTFAVPPQGEGRAGQMLKFSLSATDSDDSPETTWDTNEGDYYAVSVCYWADFDCNSRVDIADVQAVAGRWRCESGEECYGLAYDVDGDGMITVIDIMQVAAEWGWSCP
jgi:hypothetical protein